MFFDILNIREIEESSVYQGIFAKGEAKGLAEAEVKVRGTSCSARAGGNGANPMRGP